MQQMVWLPQSLDIIWKDGSKYHTLNPHKNWGKFFKTPEKTSCQGTLKKFTCTQEKWERAKGAHRSIVCEIVVNSNFTDT